MESGQPRSTHNQRKSASEAWRCICSSIQSATQCLGDSFEIQSEAKVAYIDELGDRISARDELEFSDVSYGMQHGSGCVRILAR